MYLFERLCGMSGMCVCVCVQICFVFKYMSTWAGGDISAVYVMCVCWGAPETRGVCGFVCVIRSSGDSFKVMHDLFWNDHSKQ